MMDVDLGKVEPRAKEKLRFFGAYDALRTVGRVTALVDEFFMKNFDTYTDFPKMLKPFFEHWNGSSNTKPPFIEIEWLGIGLKIKILFGAKQTMLTAVWDENTFIPDLDLQELNKSLIDIFVTIGKENLGERR